MTEHVSPLRQRMIDDMTIRNMTPGTQKVYVRSVQNFSRHFGLRQLRVGKGGAEIAPKPQRPGRLCPPCGSTALPLVPRND